MRSMLSITILAMCLAAAATPAQASGVRMFVRHDVADYAAWRKRYDDFASAQREKGVIAQAVYRSVDNPNDITVTHDFMSLKKAQEFASWGKLKMAMQESGVKGTPQVWFTTRSAGSSGRAGQVRMYIRHEVTDYATWRKTYDAFGAVRRKNGVTAQAVFQSAVNPNDLTIFHDFKSVEQARALAASPELKAAMQKAGVKGVPQVWYTTKALQ